VTALFFVFDSKAGSGGGGSGGSSCGSGLAQALGMLSVSSEPPKQLVAGEAAVYVAAGQRIYFNHA
jgi:hypothetical protein